MSWKYRIAAILTLFLTFSAHALPETGGICVMISIDGLAAHYLDDPKAPMPTLRELAKEGARASSMKAVAPTVTWPNHTTLVTGDYPARHGVVGNNYFDREAGKKIQLISDPEFDKDQIVKVPTIYDVAKAAGLKTAAIRWPASRNAKTLDWTIPDVGTNQLMQRYTTPSLLQECRAAGIYGDKVDFLMNGKADVGAVKTFELILEKHHPQLALLHIIDTDHQQHIHGPNSPEAYAAIKVADDQVREIWDILKKEYPGKATLFIVSDHGFSSNDELVLPNVLLRKAGLLNVKGLRVIGGSIETVIQGGCEFVYITDTAHHDAIASKVREACKNAKGIEKVIGPDEYPEYGVADPKADPHSPDLIIFADNGCYFGDTSAGAISFADKPERKGSHGHDPNFPNLHATFIAWGRGIQQGVNVGEIKNIDVAPTIAKLMRLDLGNTDGKPLAGVLTE